MPARLGAATAVLFCSALARAAGPSHLTFEEALRRADAAGPPLRIAAARVDEARAAVEGASALVSQNPQVSASAGPRTGAEAASIDWAVGLTQPLDPFGARGARLGMARADTEREAAAAADVRRTYLGEVARAFARTVFARDRLAVVHRNAAVAESLRAAADKRRSVGEASLIDVNVAQLAESTTRAELVAATADFESARTTLAILLAFEADDALEVVGRLDEVAEAAMSLDAKPRPDIQAIQATLDASKEEARLGAAQAWPSLGLGAQYEQEGREQIVQGTITLDLPVFQRGQQTRAAARARTTRAEAELAARKLEAMRSVANARVQAERRTAAAQELARLSADVADATEALAQRGYDAGEFSLSELLLVRRQVLDARMEVLQRQLEAADARIELAVQLGGFR